MKKLTKILVLTLGVLLLVGMLAFTVSAETAGDESTEETLPAHSYDVTYVSAGGSEVTVTVTSSSLLDYVKNSELASAGIILGEPGQWNCPSYLYSTANDSVYIKTIKLNKAADGTPLTYTDGGTVYSEKHTKNVPVKFFINNDQSFTLDLNGNILDETSGWIIGKNEVASNSASLTVKNGTLKFNSSQLYQPRAGTDLVFDNVNVVGDKGTQFVYDSGAGNIVFKDSNVDFTTGSKDINMLLNTQSVYKGPQRFIIDNSVFKLKGGSKIYFTLSALDMDWDFYILGNSKIDLSNTGGLITLGVAGNTAPSEAKSLRGTQNLYVAEGMMNAYSTMNVPADCIADLTDTNYNNDITYSTKYVKTVTVTYDEATSVPTDVVVGEPMGLASISESEDASYPYVIKSFEATEDMTLIAKTSDGTFVVNSLKSSELPISLIKSLPAGANVEVFADLNIVDDLSTESSQLDRIDGFNSMNIDLGGFTLTNSLFRMQLDGQKLDIRNGTLNYTATSGAFLFGGSIAGSEVTLTNMNIVSSAGGIKLYGGTWTLDNCTVDSAATAIGLSQLTNTDSPLKLTVKSSTVTSAEHTFSHSTVSGASATVVLENCTVNSGKAFLHMMGDTGLDGSINLSLKDTKVTTTVNPFENLYAGTVVSLDNCEFNNDPSLDLGTLDCAGSQSVAKIEGGESVVYKTLVPAFNMRAALTLYANFEIVFYLPMDTNVSEITFIDTVYNIAEHDDILSVGGVDYYAFRVSGIAASSAADIIDIYAVYTKDGLTCSQSAGYSVTGYMKTLLNSDTATADAKELVVAAVKYIQNAYTYAGLSTPSAITEIMGSAPYAEHTPAQKRPTSTLKIGNAASAVASGTFNLSSGFVLRLNLKNTYTGTLTLAFYNPDGVTVKSSVTYNVTDGLTEGGLSYVELPMRACELYDDVITLTGSGFEGEGQYSFATYAINAISSSKGSNARKLQNLLFAFNTYCAVADNYNALYS